MPKPDVVQVEFYSVIATMGVIKLKLKRLNTCWPILLCEIHFTAKFRHTNSIGDSSSTNSDVRVFSFVLVRMENEKKNSRYRKVK